MHIDKETTSNISQVPILLVLEKKKEKKHLPPTNMTAFPHLEKHMYMKHIPAMQDILLNQLKILVAFI